MKGLLRLTTTSPTISREEKSPRPCVSRGSAGCVASSYKSRSGTESSRLCDAAFSIAISISGERPRGDRNMTVTRAIYIVREEPRKTRARGALGTPAHDDQL